MPIKTNAEPGPAVEDLGASDPVRVEKAKDILHSLANAVSAMKIFPSDHATVRNFVDQLTQKFKDFLRSYQKLQVDIEEFTFTFAGKIVYSDDLAIKSLPFFFFKDGLHILFFYQGLERQEVLDFLELIRAESQKPAEDCDIVAALWERDFPNIQYYAPDEYLENRILTESRDDQAARGLPELPAELAHETIEVHVDPSRFSQGRIDLDDADREEVRKGRARAEAEVPGDGADGGPESSGRPAEPAKDAAAKRPAAAMDPTLTEAELQSLESMVRVNRTMSAEEEYIDLMVEILYLAESEDSCRASLDTLLEYHHEQLQRGNFSVAVLIIEKVQELVRGLSGSPAKTAALDEFLKRTVSPKTLEAIQALLAKKKAVDWESLLGYFRLLGPQALGLAAGLFALAPTGEARHKVIGFLEEAGAGNPGLLAGLADPSQPELSLAIVRVLARLPGLQGVPHLSAFLTFPDKGLKLEVIHLLGQARDERANRILAAFLKDKDEEVRIQAAMKLDPSEGGSRVRQMIRDAAAREFLEKSLKEKEAILSFLGRTRSPEALEFLRRTLRRAPLFASRRALEMRLASVAGLESMATGEAAAALSSGAVGRTRKVREACRTAIERLKLDPGSER
jgi:hypothetical protein